MAEIDNSVGEVRFSCPSCGKYEIVRSMRERVTAVKYKCPQCNFEGPN